MISNSFDLWALLNNRKGKYIVICQKTIRLHKGFPYEPGIEAFWNYTFLVLQMLVYQDVSALIFQRMSDWICYYRTPLCQIYISN